MALAWAKEGSGNTGSPRRRGERPQPEAREGQAGPARVAERSVVAVKRGTTVERRDLGSESERKLPRVWEIDPRSPADIDV